LSMRGAEAVISRSSCIGRDAVVKERIAKKYRVAGIDTKLRRERTRAEARLLHRAKLAGVDCPVVLEVADFSITMEYLHGSHPEMAAGECLHAGKMLATLHSAGIIHGDFTPVNLMKSKGRLFVIDFGLGFFSNDIEDKAIDVYTMLKALDKKQGEAFIRGYKTQNPKHGTVLRRVDQVKKRVRYAQ
jgi:TP53 regulating kinase-like protein